jgi:hypothetical protein
LATPGAYGIKLDATQGVVNIGNSHAVGGGR